MNTLKKHRCLIWGRQSSKSLNNEFDSSFTLPPKYDKAIIGVASETESIIYSMTKLVEMKLEELKDSKTLKDIDSRDLEVTICADIVEGEFKQYNQYCLENDLIFPTLQMDVLTLEEHEQLFIEYLNKRNIPATEERLKQLRKEF